MIDLSALGLLVLAPVPLTGDPSLKFSFGFQLRLNQGIEFTVKFCGAGFQPFFEILLASFLRLGQFANDDDDAFLHTPQLANILGMFGPDFRGVIERALDFGEPFLRRHMLSNLLFQRGCRKQNVVAVPVVYLRTRPQDETGDAGVIEFASDFVDRLNSSSRLSTNLTYNRETS